MEKVRCKSGKQEGTATIICLRRLWLMNHSCCFLVDLASRIVEMPRNEGQTLLHIVMGSGIKKIGLFVFADSLLLVRFIRLLQPLIKFICEERHRRLRCSCLLLCSRTPLLPRMFPKCGRYLSSLKINMAHSAHRTKRTPQQYRCPEVTDMRCFGTALALRVAARLIRAAGNLAHFQSTDRHLEHPSALPFLRPLPH